jgi:hypothetical protein
LGDEIGDPARQAGIAPAFVTEVSKETSASSPAER